MEGNIVSLIQYNYYGSHLQNYTDMAYIELLVFQREGVGREEGKEQIGDGGNWNARCFGVAGGDKGGESLEPKIL